LSPFAATIHPQERPLEVGVTSAQLEAAVRSGAQLEGAIFLDDAFLIAVGAVACLCKSDLTAVDLSGADLTGANLSGANVDLKSSNLAQAKVVDTIFRGVDLSERSIAKLRAAGANLQGGASLSGIRAMHESYWNRS
jgi:uncharacterized protein YjbI with pentapeptide repeats